MSGVVFLMILSMCKFHFRLWWRCRPKYFMSNTLSMGLLFIVSAMLVGLVWWCVEWKTMYFVLSVLMDNKLLYSHSYTLSMSGCISARTDVRLFPEYKMTASSANN